MNYSNNHPRRILFLLAACVIGVSTARAEEVGSRWGTEEREREYYPIVNIPIPQEKVIEAAGSFARNRADQTRFGPRSKGKHA